MNRLLSILALMTIGWAALAAPAGTNGPAAAPRLLTKEPAYQSTPKYCLITLGDRADVAVWMVEDGERLFVDKNANGDLTDDGPPLAPGRKRTMGPKSWDYDYQTDAITPANGSRHPHFVLRRWNYNYKEDNYGLSLTVAGDLPMYAGWFGTFWATNSAQAPVIHFGGPLTPRVLRRKDFLIGEKGESLSIHFMHPGSGPGAVARLNIDALPRSTIPKLTIDWPTANGGPAIQTKHDLTQRCCYWEFYTEQFAVPKGVVPGQAKVSVTLVPDTTLFELTTTQIAVPVVAKRN